MKLTTLPHLVPRSGECGPIPPSPPPLFQGIVLNWLSAGTAVPLLKDDKLEEFYCVNLHFLFLGRLKPCTPSSVYCIQRI
jgi:hypothetical protein